MHHIKKNDKKKKSHPKIHFRFLISGTETLVLLSISGTTMPSSAGSNRPEELTERLGGAAATGGPALLKALRDVKNQIIGNKTKKLRYVHLGAVPKIVSVLDSAVGGDGEGDAAMIVQAAAAIGSFACGVEDGVRAVVDAGAVPHLMRTLSHPDEKVVDAGARSLRMIYQSKMAPKYDVLQNKNMKFLVSLLNSENENVTELAASIVARTCERSIEQKALCDAGVLQRLLSLLEGSTVQRDACLESIGAILRNNYEVVTKFACIGNGKALSSIIELIQDRNPRTRLLACECLIAVGQASPYYVQEPQIKTKMIIVLIELLEEPGHAGDDAPFTLLNLILDKEELHKQAVSVDAVDKLCISLHKDVIMARRLEGILLLLAELCSKLEKCRSLMSSQVLNKIADALVHESTQVRIAACTCIQSISRSVKNLSAGFLSNEAVIVPLVQLLYSTETSLQVAALDAICNVVVEFTKRKCVFIQCGGVKQLVQLAKSMDPMLRLKSVWALRNLTFLADKVSKECVLTELTVSTLVSLIRDSENSVQEQAFALVSNLIEGHDNSIEQVLLEDGLIISAVARQLHSVYSPEACIQGMFLLSNISAGKESHKEAVMSCLVSPQADDGTPLFVLKFLRSKHNLLRTVSVWCIINLIYAKNMSSSACVARLWDAGVISQIKTMVNDHCLDCKFRVRMALERCAILEKARHDPLF